jgi:beta-D-xylosidase 4
MFYFPTMLILSTFSVCGLLDGDPKQLPYGEIGLNQVCCDAHQELALDPTRHGIVLLKNDHAI